MNCQEVGKILVAYLEAEITPSERTLVQEHLSACAGCRRALSAFSVLGSLVRQSLQAAGASAAPSPQAWDRLQVRLAQKEGSWGSRLRVRLAGGTIPFRREGRQAHAAGSAAVDLVKDKWQTSDNGPRSGQRRWTVTLGWRTHRWIPTSIVVVLALVAAFALVPALRTAAQDPLGIFRVKRFATVTIDPSTLPAAKGDPTALGSLTIHQTPKATAVSTLQEAQNVAGFALRVPKALPSGLENTARIMVTGEGRFSYTFDLEKARLYLASLGIAASSLPANLDGATLNLTIPPQVLVEYRVQGGTSPSLVLGQGRSPVLEAPPGLNVEELRRQLLALPGLPPELASQLQALEDWQHTAIIPLPKDQASSKEVSVDGVKGLYVEAGPGQGHALLWEKGGIIYGMAGGPTPEELLAAANSLSP